ncbi:uncharacterized protein H6S33_008470 [Morchella sextelata]|uniref:uncharacterized protein n=1 Tax=Morchella sextelata TaxID=1174677 RepID=UPI001D04CC48|nr:uncharacterized protein H6S33_008470 [Morchella sextelata]KAH0602820.1 hypothetical protein H6S33_008470 [Morchella sextelata]
MEKLSPEIVREILCHFDCKADLANFRLVQRSLAQLSTEFLFRTVPLKPTKLSVSRLVAIAQRPHLARHVKSLIYGIEEPNYMIWEEFNSQLRLENTPHDESEDARAQEIFKSTIDGWYDFQTSPDHTQMMATAFAALPRLEAIQMVHGAPMARERQYTYREIDYYEFEMRDKFHGEHGLEKDYLRGFAALIDAAYAAGTRLTSFKMTGMNTDEIVHEAVFEDAELLARAAAVLKGCRVMELYLGIDSQEAIDNMKSSALLNVLAPAEQLEELCLGFGNTVPADSFLFPHIFGEEQVWPALRKVELWTVEMHEYELISFLERHKDTLRTVLISSGLLFTGCWNNVMRFMKEHLQLESLEVWDLFYKHGESGEYRSYSHAESQMMVKYVREGGKCLPDQPAEEEEGASV